MEWLGHVAYMRKEKVNTEFWWGNLTERNHLEELGLDEKVILTFRHRASYIYRTGVSLIPKESFLYI
jgi:hypothetical protein